MRSINPNRYELHFGLVLFMMFYNNNRYVYYICVSGKWTLTLYITHIICFISVLCIAFSNCFFVSGTAKHFDIKSLVLWQELHEIKVEIKHDLMARLLLCFQRFQTLSWLTRNTGLQMGVYARLFILCAYLWTATPT